MSSSDFLARLEEKVIQQFRSQRVGYLFGAGSSYLNGQGYPLTSMLWEKIKDEITDIQTRDDIQAKLDGGANGIEQALDLLDDGGAHETRHRIFVTAAIAELFTRIDPPLDLHSQLVRRLDQRSDQVGIFCLNYDPLIERAAETAKVRITDGFVGAENAFFDSDVFQERIGRIRGRHRWRQFDETVKPLHLFKLHGSLGWYEDENRDVRKCPVSLPLPSGSKRLMIPPQRRKATDAMMPPYAVLWSAFRWRLGEASAPLNRLVCIGYGFADEHVNSVIEIAVGRTDFTLLMFARSISDSAWSRWSAKPNVVVVTRDRCAVQGETGLGHSDLWSFERLCEEI